MPRAVEPPDPDELPWGVEQTPIPLGRPNTRPIPIQNRGEVPIPAVGQTWELHPEGDDPLPDMPPDTPVPRGVRYKVLSIGVDNTVLVARSSMYRRVRIGAFDGVTFRYVGG